MHLMVVSDHPIDSLGYILKYEVKIELILVSGWKEAVLQAHNIGVV